MNTENTEFPPDPKFGFELKPDITYFGKVQSKSQEKIFGILDEDRRKHMYILGKTGMGKSTLLENMIIQDIYNNKGLCFLDPHGDSSEYIIKRIPERRLNDLVYFNPADLEYPIGLNILEPTSGEDPYLVVSGLMQIFAHIWAGSWSSRMEYILSNTLFALLDVPESTLLGVVRMLSDNDYKDYVITQIKNPTVKNFWVKEYAAFNDKYRTEAVAPILNKIGQFFSSEITLNIMGQKKSTINLRNIMDDGKILIINLSKGKVGESAIALIGSMIITKLQLAAMGRVQIPEAQRRDFFLYVDEFQNFTTESFATILSEARKYRLALTLAHQYIKQLEETDSEKVKNAVFGNVGTMMTFAIGAEDAAKMELEFEPIFSAQNLVNLSKFQLALKLGIKGKPSSPFMANTMGPILPEEVTDLKHAEAVSRNNFGIHIDIAKAEITEWMLYDYSQKEKSNKKRSQFSHIMGAKPPAMEKDGELSEEIDINIEEKEQKQISENNYQQKAPDNVRQEKSYNNNYEKPREFEKNVRESGRESGRDGYNSPKQDYKPKSNFRDNKPTYDNNRRNDARFSERRPSPQNNNIRNETNTNNPVRIDAKEEPKNIPVTSTPQVSKLELLKNKINKQK